MLPSQRNAFSIEKTETNTAYYKKPATTDASAFNKSQKTLIGIVEAMTVIAKDSGFSRLRVSTPKGQAIVIGNFHEAANGSSLKGLEIEFAGKWDNSKYGLQFVSSSYTMHTDEIYFFLSNFIRGFGKSKADAAMKKYSSAEIRHILDNNVSELLEVKGIGKKNLEKIKTSWEEYKHLKVLSDFFAEKGVQLSMSLMIRIEKHFGDDAKASIEKNPYILTQIRGIGFKTADKLALGLGISKDAPERMDAAISHILFEMADSKGDTIISAANLHKEIASLFDNDVPFAIFTQSLDNLYASGFLHYDDQTKCIGLNSAYTAEMAVGKFFAKERKKHPMPESVLTRVVTAAEEKNGFKFDADQRNAFFGVGQEDLTLGIFGYAGAGKTTLCKSILDMLSDYFCFKEEIIGCAFTGMAAANFHRVTGYDSQTIHSLLKPNGDGFVYNSQNKLPYKVVVIDESAMINLWLFKSLTDAIHDDALVICLGDPAQLKPIGAGNVFENVIEKGLCKTYGLHEIHRTSKDSILAIIANQVRIGKFPEEAKESGWSDFEFHEIEPCNIRAMKASGASEDELKEAREINNHAILGEVLKVTASAIPMHEDPIWDFQVLTPRHDGPVGTTNLNKELQRILNPKSPTKPEVLIDQSILRVGDKVLHLENKNMPIFQHDQKKNVFTPVYDTTVPVRVVNGSLGSVLMIDKNDEEFFVQLIDKRIVKYNLDDFGPKKTIDHAYAKTIHKAQGSQYKEVIVPFSNSHWMMHQTDTSYTAMTRARQRFRAIGQKSAFKQACTNIEDTRRLTNLSVIESKSQVFEPVDRKERHLKLQEFLQVFSEESATLASKPMRARL